MRFREFLTEADLSDAQFTKHYGRYIGMLVDMINNGDEFDIEKSVAKERLGKSSVTIDPDSIPDILQTYFGQDSIPNTGEMNVTNDGKVIPAGDSKNLTIKTTDGEDIKISDLRKPANFGTKKGFNKGQIAEGILGTAVAARFIQRTTDITAENIKTLVKQLGAGSEQGKNLSGEVEAKSQNDTVKYKLVLPAGDYNALYGNLTGNKMDPDVEKLVNAAVTFANSTTVTNAVQVIINDSRKNIVAVDSDGASDQTGTKADLFLTIDDTPINLLSLKATDVKQFGQVSGGTWDSLKNFFESMFTFKLNDSLKGKLGFKDPESTKDVSYKNYNYKKGGPIEKLYQEVERLVESYYTAGDDTEKEYNLLNDIYDGINFHATRNDTNVTMVILAPSAKVAYKELIFDERLKKALEFYNLRVEKDKEGENYRLRIFGTLKEDVAKEYGKDDLPEEQALLTMRTAKSGGAIRNVIEMEALLKTLANLEFAREVFGDIDPRIADKDSEEEDFENPEAIQHKLDYYDEISQTDDLTPKEQDEVDRLWAQLDSLGIKHRG